jgi:alpha-amylase
MPSICFYFQVHQPYRLKEYTFFEIGNNHFYENNELNYRIINKVSDKCYLHANNLLLELIKKHEGKFRISYSITGTALEQIEHWRPDVLQSFKELSKTGCVEFLAETYYHSLSFLYSKNEFDRQVNLHRELIKKHFNQSPTVFRNTELIYSNELAAYIEKKGYKGILCEGADKVLGDRNPNHLYHPPEGKIKSLLKNYRLSDDIAFRFSDKNWVEFPLTADKFAYWVHQAAGNAEVINFFMDYETFGEHQWAETGIFEFLQFLPEKILAHPDFNFKTPSEIVDAYDARDVYDVHEPVSWADTERDLSAWLSNNMQKEAMQKIYSLEDKVKATSNVELINTWARLLTSDHFYYMSTKFWADGDVHKYFSPYHSPYDAYIFYMNCLSDFELTLKQQPLEIPAPDSTSFKKTQKKNKLTGHQVTKRKSSVKHSTAGKGR